MAERDALFEAIAHGDAEHRAWLREAVDAHFAGKPVPAPRGSGNKEAKIAEQANTIEALVGALRDADALLTELLDGPSKGAFYGLERGTVMRGKIASIRAGVRKALALTSIDGGIGHE